MPKSIKIVLIILALLLFSVLFGPVTVYYLALKFAQTQYQESKNTQTPGPFVKLNVFEFKSDFRINTSDANPKTAKFRFSLGYEANQPLLEDELKSREPQLRNLIQTALSLKKADQLSGVENLLMISDEIRNLMNRTLAEGKVLHVYILESSLL